MIRAIITAIPERMKSALTLQENIIKETMPCDIIWDREKQGPWPTTRRALAYPCKEDYLLLLQDDIEITPNFHQNLLALIEAWPNAVVALYSGCWYKKSTDKLPDECLWMMNGGLSGQGLLMQRKTAIMAALWNDHYMRLTKTHSDYRIWLYCHFNNVLVLHTKPELVEHTGVMRSTIPSHNTPAQVAAHLNTNGTIVKWTSAPVENVRASKGNIIGEQNFINKYMLNPVQLEL